MLKKFVSLLAVLVFALSLSSCAKDLPDTSSADSNTQVDVPVNSVPYSSEDVSSEEKATVDTDSWKLKLVNKWNPLDEDFKPELEKISSSYTSRTDYYFDARAIDSLYALMDAAKADGIKLTIISPYRTKATQTRLFNNQVAREKSNNPNLTQAEAEVEAATAVARPRTSEHELGLAVDFDSVEESYENTAQFKWLSKNAHKYGFIMRYPKDKQSKTAVIYEPWHYRYVGEYAEDIKNSGLCLEEYLKQYK